MSDLKFISVILDDIIDFAKCKTNGSFFTKAIINANKGNIPVYGASKEENEVSYGYVKDNLIIKDKGGQTNEVKYFEDCLTWNIDGSIAIFYRKGKFSLSEKVIPLIVYDNLRDIIDLEYLKVCISQSKEIDNFNFSNKGGKGRLKNIKINIPVKEDSSYDLEAQRDIVQKFKALEEEKVKLLTYRSQLDNSIIEADFAENYIHKNVNIIELFTPENGSGTYTKNYCQKNKGDFPVYSGNTKTVFENINSYDYDGEYLTWAKDGLAGYIMLLRGKFSITNHRGILLPTDKCKNIDLEYIKYILEPIFRKSIKGRMGHDGENEYTTLNGTMIKSITTKIPIPIKEDGSYDLEAQKKIAQKYKKIDEIKETLCSQIDGVLDTKLEIINR